MIQSIRYREVLKMITSKFNDNKNNQKLKLIISNDFLVENKTKKQNSLISAEKVWVDLIEYGETAENFSSNPDEDDVKSKIKNKAP